MSNASDPRRRYFQKLENKGFFDVEAERAKNKNRYFGGKNFSILHFSEEKKERKSRKNWTNNLWSLRLMNEGCFSGEKRKS